MAFAQDEFPCNYCNKNVEKCAYSDERDWDWSTDDVCPGRTHQELRQSKEDKIMTRPMNVIELKEQTKQFEKDIRMDEQNKVFGKVLKLKKYREQPNGSMYIFVEEIERLRDGGKS